MEYKLPEVRSLTRNELLKMREAGVDVVTSDDTNRIKITAKMIDFILGDVFKGNDFGDVPQDVLNEFALAVYDKTYAAKPSEVKK